MSSVSSLSLSTATASSLGTSHMNTTVGGLDIDALVNATIQAKSLPITLLQNKNSRLQAQLNDYNTIKASLKDLQYAATDLTYSSTFSGRTAKSSDETIVTASTANGAANGSYTIDVTAPATTTHNTSAILKGSGGATFSDGSKASITGTNGLSNLNTSIATAGNGIAAGSFYINSQRIDVTSTDTVNTIVNKISASSAGVTASIDGTGHIVLTQKTVGASSKITLGTDNGTGFFTAAGLTQGGVNVGVDADQTRTLDAVFGTDTTTTGIKSGYFSINGTFFSVDSSTDTINSIVSKINSSTTAGVLAFYDTNTHTLSLTSQTAGAKDITLGTGATDTSDFLSKIGLVQGGQVKGTDASVTVNGVSVKPVNNQVTLNGNTFNIVGKVGTATVSVQNDVDSIVTKVQTFITKYNAAMDAINNKMNEKSDSSSSDASVGDLFGDPLLQSLNQSLRNFASTIVSSQPSAMQQLSQVGITTGTPGVFDLEKVKSGHLELDTTKLKNALQTNPQAVTSLFGNTLTAVNNEVVGTGDANTKTFTLKHGSISGTPTIQVGGVTYTQVSGTPKAYNPTGTPPVTDHQYSLNYTTGVITFADAPPSGKDVTANYSYDTSSGSNAGIFVQMQTLLNTNTRVGGTVDAFVGSNGSITKEMTYNNDRISDLKLRLSAEQSTLYTKYQNMQTIYQTLQSQGSYMTSLLASMNSSK